MLPPRKVFIDFTDCIFQPFILKYRYALFTKEKIPFRPLGFLKKLLVFDGVIYHFFGIYVATQSMYLFVSRQSFHSSSHRCVYSMFRTLNIIIGFWYFIINSAHVTNSPTIHLNLLNLCITAPLPVFGSFALFIYLESYLTAPFSPYASAVFFNSPPFSRM